MLGFFRILDFLEDYRKLFNFFLFRFINLNSEEQDIFWEVFRGFWVNENVFGIEDLLFYLEVLYFFVCKGVFVCIEYQYVYKLLMFCIKYFLLFVFIRDQFLDIL